MSTVVTNKTRLFDFRYSHQLSLSLISTIHCIPHHGRMSTPSPFKCGDPDAYRPTKPSASAETRKIPTNKPQLLLIPTRSSPSRSSPTSSLMPITTPSRNGSESPANTTTLQYHICTNTSRLDRVTRVPLLPLRRI